MIAVDGHYEKGMQEAAADLNVSQKTLWQYLKEGLLPAPPTTRQGMRKLRYFPEEYLEKADKALEKGLRPRTKSAKRGARQNPPP